MILLILIFIATTTIVFFGSFIYWKKKYEEKYHNIEFSEFILNSQQKCGWFKVNSNGTKFIVHCSKYVREMLSINKDLSLSEFLDLFAWRYNSIHNIKDQINSLFKSGESLSITECLNSNKNLYLEVQFSIVYWIHNKEPYLFGSISNKSKYKELQKKLEFELERNSHISKLAALGDITGLIVHEINSPLTIFLSQVKKLNQIKVDEKDEKTFSGIKDKLQKGVDKIGSIMRSIDRLDLSRGKDIKQTTPVKSIINEVKNKLGEKIRNEGINLEISNISESLTLELKSVHFTEAILVLISNCIEVLKEIPISEPRWIKINAVENEMHLCLQIIDSGKGISKDEQEKLFNSFYTTKRNSKASGLGLTIAKSIVEYNEGSLVYNSEHPNTCFEIYFPKNIVIGAKPISLI